MLPASEVKRPFHLLTSTGSGSPFVHCSAALMTDVKDSFALYLNEAFTEGQRSDHRSAALELPTANSSLWNASFTPQQPAPPSQIPNNASRKSLNFAAAPAVYVNPKQYKRIVIRRQNRMRLERLITSRVPKRTPPYLHESRHAHAMKRQRGPGGRFMPVAANAGAAEEPNASSLCT